MHTAQVAQVAHTVAMVMQSAQLPGPPQPCSVQLLQRLCLCSWVEPAEPAAERAGRACGVCGTAAAVPAFSPVLVRAAWAAHIEQRSAAGATSFTTPYASTPNRAERAQRATRAGIKKPRTKMVQGVVVAHRIGAPGWCTGLVRALCAPLLLTFHRH